ncbi:hypothetical protein GCM10027079_00900 [Sediminivirga luteola]|uniref:Uncharacterized protein n=1 Tax=Sediminivirga luteola TaxID=1774748 RepID=A0A8J2XK02_9MICO|nr:hypothetical protein GCM10011333_28840 [Sediminivirga luteola]
MEAQAGITEFDGWVHDSSSVVQGMAAAPGWTMPAGHAGAKRDGRLSRVHPRRP